MGRNEEWKGIGHSAMNELSEPVTSAGMNPTIPLDWTTEDTNHEAKAASITLKCMFQQRPTPMDEGLMIA